MNARFFQCGIHAAIGAFFILGWSDLGASPTSQPSPRAVGSSKEKKKLEGEAAPKGRQGATLPKQQALPTSRPTTTAQAKKAFVCPEDRRYGRYCLGRSIGGLVKIKRLHCPHDGEQIEVLEITEQIPHYIESDLRPELGRFGHREKIWICPRSRYAAYPQDFLKPYDRLLMERALQPIRQSFTSKEEISGVLRYQAAAAAYVARGKDARFFAEFYLRALWAAREEKDQRAAQRFRRQAVGALRNALQKKLYPLPKQPTIAYLIAELYRQDQQFFRASYWYEEAIKYLLLAQKETNQKGEGLLRLIMQGRSKVAKRDHAVFVLEGTRKDYQKKK
jgi:uncharacterized protein (DUF2225 family)